MKIYIVGSVASGKSTLARRLSQSTGIPCFPLDEVVHTEDVSRPQGNRKRTAEERDALFFEDTFAQGLHDRRYRAAVFSLRDGAG